jgi:polyadenylate-binding protein
MATASPSNCALYIGELHNDVNEAALYQFIATAGVSIISARVCRSTSTKKSLNYGYLNFQCKEDADKAMEALNYTNLMGKPVRMMYCQRDPSLRKSGKGNIIIKNLSINVQPRILLDVMKRIGNVLSLSMKPEPNGKTQNAYIQFEDEANATTACQALDGTVLSDAPIKVSKFVAQKEKFERRDMKDETFVNCYVKNLPKEKFQTEEDLVKYFGTIGDITSSKLVRDSSGAPTGAGFVCYGSHESAVKACTEFDGKVIDESPDSKPLIFSRFMRKNERFQVLKDKFDGMKVSKRPNNNVYIKNLDSTVTDETLHKEFSQFGPIISAKIMTHENGQSRGFGFVSYENPKDAATAIEKKHNTYYFSKPLHCEWAQKKEDRQMNLRNQFRMSPQYIVGPQSMQYMMRQPGSFFPQPSFMNMPQGFQMFPGNQQARPNKNFAVNNYRQNHFSHPNGGPNSMNDKNDHIMRMKSRNMNPQHQNSPQMQQHKPQQQATPLKEHEKNHIGYEFMEMIRKIDNPDLQAKKNKIVGIFLEAGYEHCKRLVDNPEIFKHSCEQILERVGDDQRFSHQQ